MCTVIFLTYTLTHTITCVLKTLLLPPPPPRHAHTHTHKQECVTSSLLHLSYSNLKLIFSHSYLPKPTHISLAVSLHFLLSSAEKCHQRRHSFEIKYESSLIKIGCFLFFFSCCCLCFSFFNSEFAASFHLSRR